LLYPDKYLLRGFITEFIIKKIILSGKFYVAYDKFFLNYGAKMVFTNDYFKEGQRIGQILIGKRALNKMQILPKYVKIIINKGQSLK